MGILLAFAPFFVFVIIERTIGIAPGLISAVIVSALLLVRDALRRKEIKVLEIGTLVLFAGLAAYSKFAAPPWSIVAVRLRVDAGLFLVVLISMAVRRPFTLQYAREQVPRELWISPQFIRINYIITAIWAIAFAVMVAAEAVLLYAPSVPSRVGIITTVLAILGAIRFTSWYPNRNRPGTV